MRKDVLKARKKVKNIDFQYLQIATIYLKILPMSRMSRILLSSNFQYFRDIDQYIRDIPMIFILINMLDSKVVLRSQYFPRDWNILTIY
jgi:hypothetical protein|tara:strand:- start:1354 stop:1620 length:267 start_codon:yes stop_codon:yes gene_type:complete